MVLDQELPALILERRREGAPKLFLVLEDQCLLRCHEAFECPRRVELCGVETRSQHDSFTLELLAAEEAQCAQDGENRLLPHSLHGKALSLGEWVHLGRVIEEMQIRVGLLDTELRETPRMEGVAVVENGFPQKGIEEVYERSPAFSQERRREVHFSNMAPLRTSENGLFLSSATFFVTPSHSSGGWNPFPSCHGATSD